MGTVQHGVVEGQGHFTGFVVERSKPAVKVCEMHGDDTVICYSGRACPMCLLADEFEQARIDARDMQLTIDELETVKEGR